ncbi:hypothetical protein GGI07_003913 [Coemansia sp. Benny D115]|nr:hypothetical protein GGI07_003913 [Coemansia sp. Benny D115]
MYCATSIAIVGALVQILSLAVAIPVPQYGPQGMGNYGYPMGNNGMMGGGGQMGYPMMDGSYGMNGGNQFNPMYNMGNGDGGRYHNGRMRGQRYHAHAGVDEWPIAKNPYMDARWNRRPIRAALYDNGPMGAGNDPTMMRAGAHNRIPMNDMGDKDSDDDEEDKSSQNSQSSNSAEGTQVGGVKRFSADNIPDPASDTNTSIDLATVSNKIINVSDFNGADIKPTATGTLNTASATNTNKAPSEAVAKNASHTTPNTTAALAKKEPSMKNIRGL